MNLVEFLFDEASRRVPLTKTAILYAGGSLTYQELYSRVKRAASLFVLSGVRPGDRVAIILGDRPEFVIAFLGAIAAGAVAVPVNAMLPSDVLSHILDHSGARALVASPDIAERLRATGTIANVWTAGMPQTDHDFNLAVSRCSEAEISPASDESLAFILYTSGSTGTPKGVMHLHRDIPFMVNAASPGVLGLRPKDIIFSGSRMFFAYGLGNSLYFPISAGATVVLSEAKPSAESIAAVLDQYRPTVFFGVPALYRAICQYASEGNSLATGSVRLCVCAGEKLPEHLHREWSKLTGLEIVDHIGSTEMLQMFISNRSGSVKPGSVGSPVPGFEAKLIDEHGEEVVGSGVGELYARGGSAFAGYWRDPERTAETLVDGWVRTRDIFRRDEDGDYWFDGRADDLFKVKGQWVSPVEVEDALLECDEVQEAAVVSGGDSLGLWQVVAFVVPAGELAASPELAAKISESISSRLPSYKRPAEIRFVPELPRTTTGKIQRYRLREQNLTSQSAQMPVGGDSSVS